MVQGLGQGLGQGASSEARDEVKMKDDVVIVNLDSDSDSNESSCSSQVIVAAKAAKTSGKSPGRDSNSRGEGTVKGEGKSNSETVVTSNKSDVMSDATGVDRGVTGVIPSKGSAEADVVAMDEGEACKEDTLVARKITIRCRRRRKKAATVAVNGGADNGSGGSNVVAMDEGSNGSKADAKAPAGPRLNADGLPEYSWPENNVIKLSIGDKPWMSRGRKKEKPLEGLPGTIEGTIVENNVMFATKDCNHQLPEYMFQAMRGRECFIGLEHTRHGWICVDTEKTLQRIDLWEARDSESTDSGDDILTRNNRPRAKCFPNRHRVRTPLPLPVVAKPRRSKKKAVRKKKAATKKQNKTVAAKRSS
ncbi:uncharacterized protein AMSG_04585 [Thecamonas trahens ATCC 50062]|uniref:Uncharacterized protein n=1 Tax=Thecamonas trahens ATCC 50062 TaxID=461836 RepID=A0A0L0D9C3_THETB|nr:hypothetical protein AMSG_04585 [Thecamonas trahens ATCC 50062]KNC48840.1 hypothetical protein AMSG_04585 [Thecamonas trahens ATCC 50062]|eukprot:XP_013758260.1 hypothetical protein AMSG_04585 [Thecamonas trahens ATCC 50062]